MPTGNLESVSLLAPGFLGLNTQDSQVGLSSGYATQADNIVIDRGGRMTSRKGHKLLNSEEAVIPTLGKNYIESIWRHDLIDGRSFYLANGNNRMFKGVEAPSITTGGTTRNFLSELDDITPSGVSIDGSRWQMQTLPEGAGSNAKIWTIATQNKNDALASREARKFFYSYKNLDLIDPFEFEDKNTTYTFFDYKTYKFGKEEGIRIDFFLISPFLKNKIMKVKVLKEYRDMERPSDHCPILMDLNI